MARKPLEYFHQGGIQQLREQEVGGAVEGAVEIPRRVMWQRENVHFYPLEIWST